MKRLFIFTLLLFAIAGGTFWQIGEERSKALVQKAMVFKASPVKTLTPRAQRGDRQAQYELGYVYETGDGTSKNIKKAIYWYQKSAIQGYPAARYRLGVLFGSGEGVRQDFYVSAKWLRMAATFDDHTLAQFRLAELYYTGRGVEHDYTQAIHFYTLAANKGHAASQYLLGTMFDAGWGVKQDFVQAYIWLKRAMPNRAEALAVHTKYDPALKFKRLTAKMNKFQISQAEKLFKAIKTRR